MLGGQPPRTPERQGNRTIKQVDAQGAYIATPPFEARYSILNERVRSDESVEAIAVDTVTRREVLLRRPVSDAGYDRERFVEGARLQAQLEHPAIVPVYELGIDSQGKDFMTVPPTSGTTLREVLNQPDLGIGRRQLIEHFVQLCLAVDYAHAKGVIHRKLEPEGIVIGDHGEVYLIDWQDALYTRPSGTTGDARVQERAGSSGYLAPEQLSGTPVDARVDVYALGAIFFEILTGERLHDSDDPYERARATLTGNSSAVVSERNPGSTVPANLEAICVRATSRDPSFRYASARQLHDDVIAVLRTSEDAETRDELAALYAEQAESDAVRALVASSGAFDVRSRALANAARAFALDPQSLGARRAVRTLLNEEPADLPGEAQEALERAQAENTRAIGRFTAAAYSVFLLILAFVPFFGLRSLAGYFVLVVALGATIVASVRIARAKHASNRLLISLIVTSNVTIACASGLYGPLVLVPCVVAANTLTLNVAMPDHLRVWVFAGGLLALLTPFVVFALGVLPPAWVVTPEGLRLLPMIREFHQMPVRLGLFASTIAAIVAPALVLGRLSETRAETSRRLKLAGWQLRQLLPEVAKADLDVGVPRNHGEGAR